MLEGTPSLYLDGRGVTLLPGACGVVPVGVPHAWRADDGRGDLDRHGGATAAASRRRASPTRTSSALPRSSAPTPLDVRDPRNRNLFRLDDWQMDVDELKLGAPVDQPTVSASMATALLAYSGIAVKMLVDQRLDAHLHTMFMVQYQETGMALPHDHPFEESYYMLEGEVDVVADDERYTLRPGDVFWTGVGCIHAFYNTRGEQGEVARDVRAGAARPPLVPIQPRLGLPRVAARVEGSRDDDDVTEPAGLTVGFAGLGRMGTPMARRVARARASRSPCGTARPSAASR